MKLAKCKKDALNNLNNMNLLSSRIITNNITNIQKNANLIVNEKNEKTNNNLDEKILNNTILNRSNNCSKITYAGNSNSGGNNNNNFPPNFNNLKNNYIQNPMQKKSTLTGGN